MTIDIKVRHVTKPGANLFRELGFAADEAERFQAESQQQINDTNYTASADDAEMPTGVPLQRIVD